MKSTDLLRIPSRPAIASIVVVAVLAMAEVSPNRFRERSSQARSLPEPENVTSVRLAETYGKLPLAFEANRGQTDGLVKFVSRGAGYSLFLTSTEAVLALRSASRKAETEGAAPAILRMKLVDGNRDAEVSGRDELAGESH